MKKYRPTPHNKNTGRTYKGRSQNRTLRNDSAAAWRSWDAAETFRGSPVGMLSLIRVAAISSGDRGAWPRWKWAGAFKCAFELVRVSVSALSRAAEKKRGARHGATGLKSCRAGEIYVILTSHCRATAWERRVYCGLNLRGGTLIVFLRLQCFHDRENPKSKSWSNFD